MPKKHKSLITSEPQQQSVSLSFGDPEPVLNGNIIESLGVFLDFYGEFYRPAVSLDGLYKCLGANPHHSSIVRFKANMMTRWLKPSNVLGNKAAKYAALDFQVFGNAYFQVIRNRLGGILELRWLPAINMRRGVDPNGFWYVPTWGMMQTYGLGNRPGTHVDGMPFPFKPGEVIHIKQPEPSQGIYGAPEYMSGLQSVWLAESAVLFRRKFYANGSHLGYILVTSNAGISAETAKAIQQQIEKSKGPGNFRSMYLNIPRIEKSMVDPVKIIPVGDIATKDDFEKIMNMSMQAILGMHRMQPGIAGVMPVNMQGFGDMQKIMQVYYELEVPPMQSFFLELNEKLPRNQQIGFDEPDWKKIGM